MTSCGASLTIEIAANGYIIRYDDQVTLVADDDPVDATYQLLGWVLEMIGHMGSRYDERRVHIVIEPGDKWMSSEEIADLQI